MNICFKFHPFVKLPTFYETHSILNFYTAIERIPHGKGMARAIQIVNTDGEHSFTLDEEALTELMLQDDVKDRSVVIISVAGAFRKGKSFLLDFFLRYMTSRVSYLYLFHLMFALQSKNFLWLRGR